MGDNYKDNQEKKQKTDTNYRAKTMIDSNMIISLFGCTNNISTDCITIKYLHNVITPIIQILREAWIDKLTAYMIAMTL